MVHSVASSGFPPVNGHAKRAPLTKQEVEESLARLYDQPLSRTKKRYEEYQAEVDARAKRAFLSPRTLGELSEDEKRMVDALYEQSLRRKEVNMEQLRSKYEFQLPAVVKKTEEERSETLDRLYSQSFSRKQQALKDAIGKNNPDAEAKVYGKAARPKTLSPGQLEESVSKLYTQSLERRKEALSRMEEEYTFRPPSPKRLPRSELDAVVERLRTKTT